MGWRSATNGAYLGLQDKILATYKSCLEVRLESFATEGCSDIFNWNGILNGGVMWQATKFCDLLMVDWIVWMPAIGDWLPLAGVEVANTRQPQVGTSSNE